MQLLAYQIFAFAISVIFLVAVNSLRDLIQNSKQKKHENERPTKYIGATAEELDEILDTLYTESCYYPFDRFENVD
jgi:hypothetical protein